MNLKKEAWITGIDKCDHVRSILGLNVEMAGPLEVHSAYTHPIAREFLYAQISFQNSCFKDMLSTKRYCNVLGASGGVDRATVPAL